MSHKETLQPEKKQVQEILSTHEKGLKKEVQSISQEVKKTLTNIAFAGGALAVAYLTISQLMGYTSEEKSEKKAEEDVEEEPTSGIHKALFKVTEVVATHAMVTLLGVAQEKLSEYLQHKKSTSDSKEQALTKKPVEE